MLVVAAVLVAQVLQAPSNARWLPEGTAEADSGASACAPLLEADERAPAVAADVRTSLELHNGVVRWDLSRGTLRLWIQSRPPAAIEPDVDAGQWQRAVLDAASGWRGVVPGLDLHVVRDSASADVIVTWEQTLQGASGSVGLAWRTAGRTTLAPANDGRAATAHVRLAVVAPTGVWYSLDDIRAVARHELGHALGLTHHAAANSVMAPLVRVGQLSAGDRAALRLLYALPVGARCPTRDALRH